MDRLFSREDLFPRLKRVDICITVGGVQHTVESSSIAQHLPMLRMAGKVYFWGEKRESVSLF